MERIRPPIDITSPNLRRVVIDPITRVEGHGKITLLLDADNHIHEARLHIVEFRGFEKFIQGRPYWEVPLLVQRLVRYLPGQPPTGGSQGSGSDGRCRSSSHQRPTNCAACCILVKFCNRTHCIFSILSSPDLLFGFGSDPAQRNIVGVLEEYPDIALKGVKLRKYGQEIIEASPANASTAPAPCRAA